jgi:hypothetical protein
MSADDIESAAEWHGERGRAHAVLIEAGFVDVAPDGCITLHNWGTRTGAGVKSLLKTRARMRDVMRNRRKNVSDNKSETLLLSPDHEKDLSLTLRESKSVSVNVSDNMRAIRPRTPNELVHCLRVAVEREQPRNGFWNPGGGFSHKEADGFLRGFADLEAALEEIEERITTFAKDPSMKPWTVAKFARTYNAIGTKITGIDPSWRPTCKTG